VIHVHWVFGVGCKSPNCDTIVPKDGQAVVDEESALVEKNVVVGAEAEHVLRRVWPVVRGTNTANVSTFAVPTHWERKLDATDLTAVFVKLLHELRDRGRANDALDDPQGAIGFGVALWRCAVRTSVGTWLLLRQPNQARVVVEFSEAGIGSVVTDSASRWLLTLWSPRPSLIWAQPDQAETPDAVAVTPRLGPVTSDFVEAVVAVAGCWRVGLLTPWTAKDTNGKSIFFRVDKGRIVMMSDVLVRNLPPRRGVVAACTRIEDPVAVVLVVNVATVESNAVAPLFRIAGDARDPVVVESGLHRFTAPREGGTDGMTNELAEEVVDAAHG
jgi:hypothetical protein